LEDAGYTHVKTHGYIYGACGHADDGEAVSCTEFTAIGPSGRSVHGAVGCGVFLKGCTIRLL